MKADYTDTGIYVHYLLPKMPGASDIYAAEPAFPVLAHSLLSQSVPQPGMQDPRSRPADGEAWDLRCDINRGIQCSRHGLFNCGKIIGVSKLRMRGADDSHSGVEKVQHLPNHVL